jgi:hypothetical protein
MKEEGIKISYKETGENKLFSPSLMGHALAVLRLEGHFWNLDA